MATTSLYIAIAAQLKEFGVLFAALTLLFGIAAFWLYMDKEELKRYAADVQIRKKCYKKKKTLGRIIDKAGTQIEFVCETDEDEPGTVESEHTLVNPNLVSTKNRGRLTNGIPVLEYVLPYFFPMSHNNANALVQLVQHIRENHKELDWIVDDLLLIRLVFCSNKYLSDNCTDVVKTCLKMDVEIPEEFFMEEGGEEEDGDSTRGAECLSPPGMILCALLRD